MQQQIQDTISQNSQWQFTLKPQPLYKQDHRFNMYIDRLKQKGVIINHKLKCGMFKLKNGLTYPGLFTLQAINQGLQQNGKGGKQIVLVSVPVNLLLTAYHAENYAPQELKALYKKQKFYHEGLIWQNRILVTYVLYSLKNSKDDIWSEMASYFSKDIDIAQFWPQQDLKKFADKSLIKAALSQKQNFQKQWQNFQQVKVKHPVLQGEVFNYINYKWIYTHVVSRCFGSYMNSSYFTPFCQFLNHSCVDVSFCCVQQMNCQQPQIQIPKCQNKQQKEKQDQDQISSISECSGDSQQYIQQDDFSYQNVTTYNIKWFSKISFNLKPKQMAQIQKAQEKVNQYMDRQLNWRGFTLLYIGQILQKNNLIVNQYMAERKKFFQAKQELDFLLYHVGQFARKVREYYKGLGSCYIKDKDKFNKVSILQNEQMDNQGTNNEKYQKRSGKQQNSQQIKYLKTTKPPQKDYKYFQMVCHSRQKYEKNCQVYFQYGRLSNRTLLLCYGFCLQNNMYEHVWIHRSLAKQIGQYPDLFKKIQDKGIPITFNIKLKPYVLNTQLIILQKIQKWKIYGNVSQNNVSDFEKMFGIMDLQVQCEIIGRVIEIYQQEKGKYEINHEKFKRLKSGLIDLQNQMLTYHEYFTAVYHNQKIKIIQFQIYLLKKICKVFKILIQKKVKIKGNKKLLTQVKSLFLTELREKQKLIKAIFGYIKTLCVLVIS